MSSDVESIKLEEIKYIIRAEKYNIIEWAHEEKLYKYIHPETPKKLKRRKVPVSVVLDIRLKFSCFGRFMKCFNKDLIHNSFWNEIRFGMEEADYRNLNRADKKRWDFYHNFSDNLFELLRTAVHTKECIDYDFVYKNLKTLRLNYSKITVVDSLVQFENLEVLVLAANWIKSISGRYLPTNIQFLELYGNKISSVRKLCGHMGPKQLKYLGVGRNHLTNKSYLHLLASSGNFVELRFLDLSNNNIYCLADVLEDLKNLNHLRNLSLEGNPCYTCETYKGYVLHTLPKLIYLDGTEILPEDRVNGREHDLYHGSRSGAFIFNCYRIIGIPPPPKGNVTHNFYLSVELPLLEAIRRKTENKSDKEREEKLRAETIYVNPLFDETGDHSTQIPKDSKSPKKSKENRKSTKKGRKIKKSEDIQKPVNGPGLYSLEDEYEAELKDEILDTSFKSEEKPWAKIITFESPSIVIDVPDNNLILLRDTFRSRVKVKLVYIQRVKPKKDRTKKGTNTNSTLRQPKSNLRYSKGDSISANRNSNSLKEPKFEKILKKCTFASFYCHLQPVNWSDNSMDFIWAEHEKVGKTAILVEGTLRPEIYADKRKSKVRKDMRSEMVSQSSEAFPKSPIPKMLTVNIGFGLKRSERKITRPTIK